MDNYFDEIYTFEEFIQDQKKKEIIFDPPIKLIDFKYDGRKNIYIYDIENKCLEIKFSYAKQLIPNLLIKKFYLDDCIDVDIIFNFSGGKL